MIRPRLSVFKSNRFIYAQVINDDEGKTIVGVSEKELKKVLNMKDIPLLGINNRNLHTLGVDFKTTEKLFPLIPKDKVVVVESGIKTHQDVLFLKILGVSAVLIGEAFMEAEDIGKKVEEIMGW